MLTTATTGGGGGGSSAVRRSVEPTTTPVWFGAGDRPLFGQLVLPADGAARGGVVLCPPMGEESRASHRTLRRLAEDLAAAGLACLRFDYDGTGDSAGAQDDPDRVDAWLGSVEAARAFVRGLGLDHVAAVGMRLGATIAGGQAVAGGGFDDLVLWDPCASGRTFLREGEALYAFSVGLVGGVDVADAVPPDDGYRHTPGYQYDAATARAMRRLDLARPPDDADDPRLADRVLLLVRDDRPAPDAVVARVRAGAPEVVVEPALDQAALLDTLPSEGEVPERAVARIVDWLVSGAARHPLRPVAVPGGAGSALVPSAGPGSVVVRERPVRLGPAELFGLVTEPVDDPGPGRPWVVLVNVATEHHVGPGRRWVDLAREWAAQGWRCVRIDQSGIGDSPVRPDQPVGTIYSEPWLRDVAEIVDDLRADGSPVGLVGLCSGGNAAFEAAMRTHVDGVFTINPAVTLYGLARGEALWTPERKAAVVPVRPISWLSQRSERERRVSAALWRTYRQVALWHAPALVLARVARRGTKIHVLVGRNDGRDFVEVLGTRPLLWWLRRRGVLELEVDTTIDHSMLSRRVQGIVRERATAFVRELHDGPRPARSRPRSRRR